MTIKELEQAVGMTRANIRFYEQEGLLSPARGANGYRDYSPDDADALRKIKLLRMLHLDLNSIRALQKGELTLSDALSAQLRTLERDQAALDRAREVCAQLRDSGTDYAALDAAPWLDRLDRPPVSERFAPPEDQAPAPEAHPWRRFFARSLDQSLCSLPLSALLLLACHFSPGDLNSLPVQLLRSYLAIGIMFLVEPLLLHYWGTTPGKALFGITVRDADGEKLTLAAARRRMWGVFSVGMGYGIPLFELWRNYKSYTLCTQGEPSPWAYGPDGRAERMDIPDSAGRCAAFVGAEAALLALSLLLALQSQLPPRRGELDLASFAENYNFYADYLDLDITPLGPDGKTVSTQGAVVVELFPSDLWQWSAIEEGGRVVGFRWDMEAGGNFLYLSGTPQVLGLMSCAGALPTVNCLNFRPDRWTAQLPDDLNYDFTYRGLRVSQTAVFTGAEPQHISDSGPIIFPDGQEGHMALTFTVRLA